MAGVRRDAPLAASELTVRGSLPAPAAEPSIRRAVDGIHPLGDGRLDDVVALVWIAFERGGAGLVSALVVVSTAPVIAGGFAMGLLLDCSDRLRVLVA